MLQAPPSLSQKATTAATTMAMATNHHSGHHHSGHHHVHHHHYFFLPLVCPSFFLLLLLSLRLGGIWNSWEHREEREREDLWNPRKGNAQQGSFLLVLKSHFKCNLLGVWSSPTCTHT